jgi:hypothetical protein
LLVRENLRLEKEINALKTSEELRVKSALLETGTNARKGKLAKENKIHDLKAEIEKEKHIESNLKTQAHSYETSLKLMLELQKNLVSLDVDSKSVRKTSQNSCRHGNLKSKSK